MIFTFLFITGLSLLVTHWVQNRRWKAKLPPGPKGYPIIGNLLDMPKAGAEEWLHFAKWRETWGDLTSATIHGMVIINIHTYQKAKELLEDKSLNYSDRPILPMLGELIGWKNSMAIMGYNANHRECRRLFHQELGSETSVRQFDKYEEQMTWKFIQGMLDSPGDWYQNVEHHIASMILRITYGYIPQEKDDPIIRLIEATNEGVSRSTAPGVFLVNHIPFLLHMPDWLPGTGFKRIAAKWSEDYFSMVNTPFNMVVKGLNDGTAKDSFTLKWLRQDLTETQMKLLKHTSSDMYSGGAGTSTLVLHLMFYIMATRPDIQSNAQEEIDRVVGHERLPVMSDQGDLPYIKALTKELLRFRPPLPHALPHSATEEGIHDGYLIPKGATILPNVWQMSRDSNMYSDPDTFEVSRFLGRKPEQDPAEYVFGFGRRRCPGYRMAELAIYITAACTLATFNITPAKDPHGKLMVPEFTVLPGVVGFVKEFKCSVNPRNPNLKLQDLLDEE